MLAILNRTPARCVAIATLLGLLLGPVTIPYRVLVLTVPVLIWTLLEARNLRPIGFSHRSLRTTLIWGIAIAVGVLAFAQTIEPLLNKLFGLHSDLSSYGALAGNAPVALKLLSYALTSAAFGEEILFRGFLLHQVTAILGSGNRARWVAILTGGLLFGFAHAVQGPMGILSTGIVGVIFGWAWFRSNRNLWALILAHALIDSFGIAMLYLGWSAF